MKKANNGKANSKKWQTLSYKQGVAREAEKYKMFGASGKKRSSEEASRNNHIAKILGLI